MCIDIAWITGTSPVMTIELREEGCA